MTADSQTLSRAQLRQQLRQQRRALSPLEQRHAAQGLAKQIKKHPWFYNANSIALYLPNDGEISPLPLLHTARQFNKRCFLPVLHPIHKRLMWFAEFRWGDALKPNRFGILEPDHQLQAKLTPGALDLVLMPLVGFDVLGARLGMGGGFYDRTFAFKLATPYFRKPRLVGLAHELQKVDRLVTSDWDIPMDGVITDKAFYCFDNHLNRSD